MPRRRRFPIKNEVRRIERGLDYVLEEVGTRIWWYFHDSEQRDMHPVYGEAYSGGGASWRGPVRIPALDVEVFEGTRQNPEGFHTTDRIRVIVESEDLRQRGLGNLERDRDRLRDRFVYQGVVYTMESAQIRGRVGHEHDIEVEIQGSEVDPDELVNDPVFHVYADLKAEAVDPPMPIAPSHQMP